MNLFAATRAVETLKKQFAAAGLSLDAFVSGGDEFALKAHIEQLVTRATAESDGPTDEEVAAMVDASVSKVLVDAGLAVSDEQPAAAALSAIVRERDAMKAALATAGIKAATAAELPAALEKRIALRAGEELAKRGLRDFPEAVVTDDPAKANPPKLDPTLKGRDRYRADFDRQLSSGRLAGRN